MVKTMWKIEEILKQLREAGLPEPRVSYFPSGAYENEFTWADNRVYLASCYNKWQLDWDEIDDEYSVSEHCNTTADFDDLSNAIAKLKELLLPENLISSDTKD